LYFDARSLDRAWRASAKVEVSQVKSVPFSRGCF
jgi:hypothetical protein